MTNATLLVCALLAVAAPFWESKAPQTPHQIRNRPSGSRIAEYVVKEKLEIGR